jgi:hypothetical protein
MVIVMTQIRPDLLLFGVACWAVGFTLVEVGEVNLALSARAASVSDTMPASF